MWREKDSNYNYKVVENEGGKTLTYEKGIPVALNGVKMKLRNGLHFQVKKKLNRFLKLMII